jgi:SWI/SNF-related matrix-associated actin-dependent regulator 1 of chromatin subfamily A
VPVHIIPPSREAQAEAERRAAALAEGLFAHQIEGVAFLLGRRRAILADDMGLGKTRQSVVALTEAAPEGPYLVICPASVKRNWQREILAARPGSEVSIIGPGDVPARGFSGWAIINYDILGKHIDALLKHTWAGLVFDEAHYLKNHKSQRSKFGRQLVDTAGPDPIVHMLTGTPLTNRPRDLFPLLQLARHPMARSFLSFAKRYCAAEHNGYGWVTTGASNLDELRQQLHGLMLRRTKDDVLDLPPKVRTWLPVDVPEHTAKRESRRVLELLIAYKTAPANERGSKRIALLGELAKARRKLAIAKIKHTIDLVQDAVEQDEKVLVFSCFSDPALAVAEHFGDAALLLTGETPSSERQGIADAFQSDDRVRVLVANIIAGGVGLNLTAARQVVFNDLDWVPANHWQAEDRAYRIGQTRTVNGSYMVAAGTIDDFVARTLETKAALVDVVVEGAYAPADLLSSLEELVGSMRRGSPILSPAKARMRWIGCCVRSRGVRAEVAHRGAGAHAQRTHRRCHRQAGGSPRRAAHRALPRAQRAQSERGVHARCRWAGCDLQLPGFRIPRQLHARARAQERAHEWRGAAAGVSGNRLSGTRACTTRKRDLSYGVFAITQFSTILDVVAGRRFATRTPRARVLISPRESRRRQSATEWRERSPTIRSASRLAAAAELDMEAPRHEIIVRE